VINVEQWHAIRCLHQRGYSRRRIARELGLSRNTVNRALDGSEAPAYSRKAPVSGEETHDQFIRHYLRQGMRGSRILTELRERHRYAGSQASFYRALSRVRAGEAEPKAALRFETAAGEQSQFDWAEYIVPIGSAATKVFIFGLLLGFSRRCHWFPSLSVKQPAVFEALEASWRHFAGACRDLVVDNARCFVIKHTRSELVWHPLFLQLCGHYRVQPIAATPRHPRGKGKVENPFGLLQRHFIEGSRWSDFGQFQQALGAYEARWEERAHGTTGVSPRRLFAQEWPALIPLPPSGYFGVRDLRRQVSGDCLVSYEGVRYSVPAPYAGKNVWIRPSQGRSVIILAPSGEQLADHVLPPAGTRLVVCPEHFAALRRRHEARLPTLTARFRARFGSYGELAESFLQRFIGQATYSPDRQLGRLLELLSTAPDAIALQVLADGLEFNLLSGNFLESRLLERMKPRPETASPLPTSLQGALPELEVERPLDTYAQALPSAATEVGAAADDRRA
jgi:transposase